MFPKTTPDFPRCSTTNCNHSHGSSHIFWASTIQPYVFSSMFHQDDPSLKRVSQLRNFLYRSKWYQRPQVCWSGESCYAAWGGSLGRLGTGDWPGPLEQAPGRLSIGFLMFRLRGSHLLAPLAMHHAVHLCQVMYLRSVMKSSIVSLCPLAGGAASQGGFTMGLFRSRWLFTMG